jgi:mono/diheme cytochrome c family protein
VRTSGRRIVATAAALALAALAAACGSVRRGEPIVGPMQLGDASAQRGKVLFSRYCYRCHPGGEGGLGPALNDKPPPAFLIRTQVRLGLGAMPSFSEDVLPSEDLDDIVAYVLALRHHD